MEEIQQELSEFDADRVDDIVWSLVEVGLITHSDGRFYTAPSDG